MIKIWDQFVPVFIRNQIKSRPVLQKVAGNTGWLFIDRVLRLAVAMVVGIWVARYLGPEQFGLLSYAGAFVGLFAAVAHLGLNDIVVRELVKVPAEKHTILGTTFVLQLVGGLATFGLAVGAIFLVRPGDKLAHLLVLILAASPIFGAFNAIDFWFQSQIKSKFTVIAKSASLLFTPVLKIVLILWQAPLLAFAVAGLIGVIIGAIGLLTTYQLTGESVRYWRPQLGRAKELVRESWPLLLSAIAIVIYMKIDQIMLKELVGDEATGLYAAAVRISEVWYFVPMTIISSLFPVLVAAKKQGEEAYYQKFQTVFRLMAGLAFSVAIPMTFLSGWTMTTLFGVDYANAGPILAIHIWAGLPVAMGVATTPWLINEGYTHINLQKTIVGAVINVLLNIVLIPKYAGIGAAIATVVAYLSATFVWHIVHPRMRHIGLMQLKALLCVRE